MREATVSRTTAETAISVTVNLDGTGTHDCQTGVGFFDHMLDQLARHSLIDLTIRAKGDLHIDDHHTVEDVGIALGQALTRALGDKRGIRRYGHFRLAMDDAQIATALDLSARPYLIWTVDFPTGKIGSFDTELVREFFQALSTHGGITLHVDKLHGLNSHHIAEAAFKSVARALRQAVEPDPRLGDALPSTKGAPKIFAKIFGPLFIARPPDVTHDPHRSRRLRFRQSAFRREGVSAHGGRGRRR